MEFKSKGPPGNHKDLQFKIIVYYWLEIKPEIGHYCKVAKATQMNLCK